MRISSSTRVFPVFSIPYFSLKIMENPFIF